MGGGASEVGRGGGGGGRGFQGPILPLCYFPLCYFPEPLVLFSVNIKAYFFSFESVDKNKRKQK